MATIDKAALLASRGIGTQMVEVTIKGQQGEVEVRGLTRAEVLSIQSIGATNAAVMEQKLLAFAMVNPALTEDEVAQWQNTAPAGELEPISSAIQELSGLKVAALKEEIQQFRE